MSSAMDDTSAASHLRHDHGIKTEIVRNMTEEEAVLFHTGLDHKKYPHIPREDKKMPDAPEPALSYDTSDPRHCAEYLCTNSSVAMIRSPDEQAGPWGVCADHLERGKARVAAGEAVWVTLEPPDTPKRPEAPVIAGFRVLVYDGPDLIAEHAPVGEWVCNANTTGNLALVMIAPPGETYVFAAGIFTRFHIAPLSPEEVAQLIAQRRNESVS